MKTEGIKELQFVQQVGLKLEGFGIVADADSTHANIMFADMDSDFGTIELSLEKFKPIHNEADIRSSLKEIEKDSKKYAYFIIQLNDIPELKDYHIEEDDFVANIRKSQSNSECQKLDEKIIQEIISVSNHDTAESVLNAFDLGVLEVYPNKEA